MSQLTLERLRPWAKRTAPRVLTRLPGSSVHFGPPRDMVRSAIEWERRWNARCGPGDAAEYVPVHPATPIVRAPSSGVQGLDWAGLSVHARENCHELTVGSFHPGTPTFALSMPRGRVCEPFAAVITPDDGLLAKASFGFSKDPVAHPVRRALRLGRSLHLDGTVATVAGGHSDAYFHWFFDVLPRVELLRLAGWDPESLDHIVVNGSGASYEDVTLERLGVPMASVHRLTADTQVVAERLIAPSTTGTSGNVPLWACELLRERFLPTEPPAGPPLRLYISRNDTMQRRLIDEDRLVARLEPLGFTCLTLDGRSIDEQIDLFSRAEIVVGPHGGGLTNLIWCTPGTTIVELYAHDYVNPVFWGLSEAIGLRHHHVIGDPATPGIRRGLGAMVVDHDIVMRTVETALATADV